MKDLNLEVKLYDCDNKEITPVCKCGNKNCIIIMGKESILYICHKCLEKKNKKLC